MAQKLLWFILAIATASGSLTSCTNDVNPPPSLEEIVSDLSPDVVRVEASKPSGDLAGSGFVLAGTEGLIVTAYHVIEGASSVTVRLGGSMSSTNIVAKLIAFDKELDLALLGIPPIGAGIELSESPVLAGSTVLAMGYPFSLEGDVSVSQGIISRNYHVKGLSYVQHDAEILYGNSGGPLLNTSGELVGVNIARLSDVETASGLNFAVHVSELIKMMSSAGLVTGAYTELQLIENTTSPQAAVEDVAVEATPYDREDFTPIAGPPAFPIIFEGQFTVDGEPGPAYQTIYAEFIHGGSLPSTTGDGEFTDVIVGPVSVDDIEYGVISFFLGTRDGDHVKAAQTWVWDSPKAPANQVLNLSFPRLPLE